MQRKFTPNAVRVKDGIAYIALTNKHKQVVAEAMVDEADLPLVQQLRWSPSFEKNTQSYYAFGAINGKRVQLHRLIMGAKPSEVVDHINHDSLDCRRSNLRTCTNQENLWNRSRRGVRAKGGLNVSWNSANSRWRVRMEVSGKHVHVGYFDDLQEAQVAAEKARRELRGEYAPKTDITSHS